MTNNKTPGVGFFGKVRIATRGHRKAIDTAKGIAKKVGGQLHIGLSGTSHPLTPEQKKTHAEAMFDHPVESGTENTKNIFSFLSHLHKHHDDIHLVAGSDRAPEYRKLLSDWNGKPDKSGKVAFNFKKWKVHEVEGKREDVDKHPSQMSDDELDRSVSASKLEDLAKKGDYEGFRAYHKGLPETHVKNVYSQIRKGLSTPQTASKVKKKLTEELDHKQFAPMLDSFVSFASDRLGIKSLPTMKLSKDDLGTSFGGYNPSERSIVVVSKNRHPMDVFRTVAHELIHHKQNEDGRLGKDIEKEGATGSDIENEANAEAGKIMRWFAKKNPEAFKSGYVVEEIQLSEGLNDPGKLKAVFLAGGPGSGKDFVMNRVLAGHGLTEINSDNALEYLMKKRGLSTLMPKEEEPERNAARGTAKNITKEKQRLALAGRRGLIINGTADDSEKIAQIKKHLEDNGYETKMLFVNTSDEVSKQRNIQRGMSGGRKVPDGTNENGIPNGSPDIRGEKWRSAQEAKEKLRELFGDDHFKHVDNSDDYRIADKQRKKEIDNEHLKLFKHFRDFVSTPASSEKGKNWIEAEKKKRKVTDYRPARANKVSQRPSAPYVPNASELEQAKRLGVTHLGNGAFGKSKDQPTHVSKNGQLVMAEEKGSLSLKNWFDKSRSKDGKKGWVQVGGKFDGKPCARQEGQKTTPKCRSSSEAAQMTKKEKEYAFRKKNREDDNQPQKSGAAKPTMVKTYKTQKESVEMKRIDEKKDACYYKVKSRYKVWPSAYASGALVKCRKKGDDSWGNKSKVDENFEKFMSKSSNREEGTDSIADIYKSMTPGQKIVKKKLAKEDNNLPRGGLPVADGVGPETTQYRPMTVTGFAINESVEEWVNRPSTQQRFIEKYGNLAEQKLCEAAERLSSLEFANNGPKFFTHLREAWEAIGGRDMGTVSRQGNKEEVSEQSFNSAFSSAKKSGADKFEWKGKTYTTQMKGEKPKTSEPKVAQPKIAEPKAFEPKVEPKSEPEQMKTVSRDVDAKPQNSSPDTNKGSSATPSNSGLSAKRSTGDIGTPTSKEKVDKHFDDMRAWANNSFKGEKPEFSKTSGSSSTPRPDAIMKGSRYDDGNLNESEAWQRKEGKDMKNGGLNRKGIASYRRANPGSKLSMAVTTPPSKLKPGSKKAKRRLSFCRRMKGMKAKLTSAETARDPNSRINKSLRKWNCEE